MKKQLFLLFFSVFLYIDYIHSMVTDSRYFPWYPYVYDRTVNERSIFQASVFFMTATKGRGDEAKEKIGIPEIWGTYDQKKLNDALDVIGKTSPLLGQWQLQRSILWNMKSNLEGQGLSIQGEYGFQNGVSLGFSTGAMHLDCSQDFFIPRQTSIDMGLTSNQILQIDYQRRLMNDILGFKSCQWEKSGLIDSEVHIRYGLVKDYVAKCRKIDIGCFAGIFIPTGVDRNPLYPFSIPFGGNGHWGFYSGCEGMFELKEDWELSARFQISKRFSKNFFHQRMPVAGEWIFLGAVEGEVEIDPGVTVMFSPAFTMNDLRNGWGAGLQYVITTHSGDVWTDKRPDKTIKTNLNSIYSVSKWISEYVIVKVGYDPFKEVQDEGTRVVLTFEWDIPVKILAAEGVSKTNMLAIEAVVHF